MAHQASETYEMLAATGKYLTCACECIYDVLDPALRSIGLGSYQVMILLARLRTHKVSKTNIRSDVTPGLSLWQ